MSRLNRLSCRLQVTESAESAIANVSQFANNESPCTGGSPYPPRSPARSNLSEEYLTPPPSCCSLHLSERAEMQMRLGLLYVRGLRAEACLAIVREREKRPFSSIEDLRLRVPELRKTELRSLAEIGALNEIATSPVRSTGFSRVV